MPGMAILLSLLLSAPADAQTPAPHSRRPSVAVMDFDYGTLQTHWWGEYDIGKGVAIQVVDLLVDDGSLRVVERGKLDTVLAEQDFAAGDRASPDAAKLAKIGKVLGVRYILAGSITKFATSDKKYGGGMAGTVAKGVLGPVGGLTFRKAKQEVTLTGRLIDATTGEIVVSAQGEGVAKKGGGVGMEAGYGGTAGAVGTTSEPAEVRALGMSEAQLLAATELARAIVAQAGKLSAETPEPEPTPTPPPPPAQAAPAKKTPPPKAPAAARPPKPSP